MNSISIHNLQSNPKSRACLKPEILPYECFAVSGNQMITNVKQIWEFTTRAVLYKQFRSFYGNPISTLIFTWNYSSVKAKKPENAKLRKLPLKIDRAKIILS